MKYRSIQLILISLLLTCTISCKQIFTSSLTPFLARDSITISSKASMDSLLDFASNEGASDPAVALAILKALGGKSADEVRALSAGEKATVLNLAVAATIDMSTITNLAKDATAEGSDPDKLIESFFDNFDSSADLSAIEVILADTDNMDSIPAESLVFASAVVAANLVKEMPADDLLGYLEGGDTASLPAPQKEKIDLIIGVKESINNRPDLSEIDIGGFNLLDLLGKKGGI